MKPAYALLASLVLASSPLTVPMAWADAPAAAPSNRTADQVLADIDAMKMPTLDRTKTQDQAYVQTYVAERQAAMKKRAELIGELWKLDPKHPRGGTLFVERWQILSQQPDGAATAAQEVEQAIANTSDADAKKEYRFAQVQLSMMSRDPAARENAARLAQQFVADYADDKRSPSMLSSLARMEKDPEKSRALLQQLIEKYPTSPAAASAKGTLKQLDGVGKPVELSFADAVTGKEVSIAGLKGKVIVLDFWATWCGPCIAEMPHMKELYAKFKDQGVEFIGISLDQPGDGLDKLKAYVAENNVTWPQYYQGKGWESEFSRSWGINAIPALFVVDHEGNLVTPQARGKLEELLPKLIAKRDSH